MLEYPTRLVGIESKHALRHQYAAERYEQMTGTLPPNANPVKPLTDWAVDDEVRQIIAAELGHGRKAIANAYLDKPVKRPKQAERIHKEKRTRRGK